MEADIMQRWPGRSPAESDYVSILSPADVFNSLTKVFCWKRLEQREKSLKWSRKSSDQMVITLTSIGLGAKVVRQNDACLNRPHFIRTFSIEIWCGQRCELKIQSWANKFALSEFEHSSQINIFAVFRPIFKRVRGWFCPLVKLWPCISSSCLLETSGHTRQNCFNRFKFMSSMTWRLRRTTSTSTHPRRHQPQPEPLEHQKPFKANWRFFKRKIMPLTADNETRNVDITKTIL